MKVIDSVSIRIEQKSEQFQSDILNCHGFSIANLGTSDVVFKFLSDGGETIIRAEETVVFDSVAHVPFKDDVLEGRFIPAVGVLQADRVDLVRIVKYIGDYIDC